VGRGPLGLRAAGSPGRRGPWAVGRWAAGLLLAKPKEQLVNNFARIKTNWTTVDHWNIISKMNEALYLIQVTGFH